MNRQTEEFMAGERTRPAAGVSHPHESAHLHVAGEAIYVDDIPEIAGTLHAALGLSEKAHARIRSLDLAPVRSAMVSTRSSTNWPPLTTPALAVNTRSGRFSTGGIVSTAAPAASNVARKPRHCSAASARSA